MLESLVKILLQVLIVVLRFIGSVAEWFKATVLKTVVPFGNREFESLRFRKFALNVNESI